MKKTEFKRKYSPEEIEEQKIYLSKAKSVTESEKRIILNNLENGYMDTGIFSWVRCPVWRYRLYKTVESGIIEAEALNDIMKYILEGEKIK